MYAADTGVWRWRAKTNYPIQSGVTSTAGGIVFFGDMGGNIGPGDRAIWERTENWRKVRVPNNLASRHRSRSGWVKSLNLLMNKHGDLRPGAEPVQGFLGR